MKNFTEEILAGDKAAEQQKLSCSFVYKLP
jgi:hypothetical protein